MSKSGRSSPCDAFQLVLIRSLRVGVAPEFAQIGLILTFAPAALQVSALT